MKKKIVASVLLLFSIHCVGHALALTLYNNTPYPLRVQIIAHNGVTIGEVHLNAESVVNWSTNLGAPAYGTTPMSEAGPPYTVSWYCKGGSPYSSCTYVPEGTLVYANLCPGPQGCPQKPPKGQSQSQ